MNLSSNKKRRGEEWSMTKGPFWRPFRRRVRPDTFISILKNGFRFLLRLLFFLYPRRRSNSFSRERKRKRERSGKNCEGPGDRAGNFDRGNIKWSWVETRGQIIFVSAWEEAPYITALPYKVAFDKSRLLGRDGTALRDGWPIILITAGSTQILYPVK